MWHDRGAIPKMAIILQYVNVSNQHAEHLKFIQCYMSNTFQLKNKPHDSWF